MATLESIAPVEHEIPQEVLDIAIPHAKDDSERHSEKYKEALYAVRLGIQMALLAKRVNCEDAKATIDWSDLYAYDFDIIYREMLDKHPDIFMEYETVGDFVKSHYFTDIERALYDKSF